MNGLLATLHPKIRWNPPVLEIRGVPSEDVHLNGRGIQLTPALFLAHRPGVVIGVNDEQRQAALAFPTTPSSESRGRLWDVADDGDRPVAALVGPTRADALARLREDPCTTGELAARLGISSAGASQHASVLRRAGLITTRRDRNSSLHVVTTLGTSLLDGRVVSQAFRSEWTGVPLQGLA
jgi:DNA-binding transcriptional ArsR family regulator